MELSLGFLKAAFFLFKPMSIKLSLPNLKAKDLITATSAAITMEVTGRAPALASTEQLAMSQVIVSIYITSVPQCLLITNSLLKCVQGVLFPLLFQQKYIIHL